MGKHFLVPLGFDSLEQVVSEINNYDNDSFTVFLNCFGKEMERQAVYDEYKGNKKLANLGLRIYSTINSAIEPKIQINDEEFYKIRLFSYQVSFLRYDSIAKIFHDLIKYNKFKQYVEELKEVQENLDNLWKMSAKHML